MPHLDEGALWVRATMPYTISFEEASSIAPQIRKILMSYPQVTVVGSELGRPDDGTDPTGFFNCEFYVGLKPYKDKAWSGDLNTKDKLIESINKKLTAFPGIIFNYTQPAEDAVDEALTGLKSSLAVKIYGDDLTVLQDKAIQIKNALSQDPGLHRLDRGSRTWTTQPVDRCGPRQNCALWNQCRRCGGCDFGRRRRTSRDPGHSGRKSVRPGGAHAAPIPQQRT